MAKNQKEIRVLRNFCNLKKMWYLKATWNLATKTARWDNISKKCTYVGCHPTVQRGAALLFWHCCGDIPCVGKLGGARACPADPALAADHSAAGRVTGNWRRPSAQDGRKKFEKQTQKFCSALDRYLNLSTKKLEEHTLREVSSGFERKRLGSEFAWLQTAWKQIMWVTFDMRVSQRSPIQTLMKRVFDVFLDMLTGSEHVSNIWFQTHPSISGPPLTC